MTSIDGYRIDVQNLPHNADALDDCVCVESPWPGPPYMNVPDTEENRRTAHRLALEMWEALNAEESPEGHREGK